ncbi:vWA-MoxR associated conflict system protein [Streptomyces sp. SD15]
MTSEPLRHVLVVGAQCKAMGTLKRLEQAAQELHAVLTAPVLGGCRSRVGEYPSLLVGAELEPEDVRKAVHEAVRQARADNAVLVVALLGHGFTTPQQTDLYYMVGESTTGSTMSAVNVGQILTEAVDEPGVEGVIALVDTCHAAGAMPDAGRLAGGVRAGRTRLSVLTAAAADQPARDMRLTFALVEVLRAGLAGAGDTLYADRRLTDELRARVAGQAIGRFEHDNDPFALAGLWLARNVRHVGGSGGEVVGPVGRKILEDAVGMWRAQQRLPERLTRSALDELHTFARTGLVEDAAHPHWRTRVGDVVATLLECIQAVDLLSEVFAEVLTSDILRSARQLAKFPYEAEGPELLRDLVEYAALRTQTRRVPQWRGLARFVAALAHLSGTGGTDPRIRAWARRLRVNTEFNDALAEFTKDQQQQELRLVISLAGAWTDWPEELDAWLVSGAGTLPVHQRFRCESADRLGAVTAMGDALVWAREQLPVPQLLVNVDVAAPAHLLAQWHPEEARIGRRGPRLLGAKHAVVVRWSGRMDPGEENSEMNDAARKTLRAMASCGKVPVEWVDAAALCDPTGLEQGLVTGQYDTAVGIDHHPESLHEVLDLLLPYAPIILWPRPEARPGDGRLQMLVQQQWHELPGGFTAAYQNRWSSHEGCLVCLGDVRAVWHDEAWLEFCRPFENRFVAALEEEQ